MASLFPSVNGDRDRRLLLNPHGGTTYDAESDETASLLSTEQPWRETQDSSRPGRDKRSTSEPAESTRANVP
jgi:hypothetical protein